MARSAIFNSIGPFTVAKASPVPTATAPRGYAALCNPADRHSSVLSANAREYLDENWSAGLNRVRSRGERGKHLKAFG
jgi:hypothetical protein